jgi:hypothetical protein
MHCHASNTDARHAQVATCDFICVRLPLQILLSDRCFCVLTRATAAGIDSLFIAGGIHAEELGMKRAGGEEQQSRSHAWVLIRSLDFPEPKV